MTQADLWPFLTLVGLIVVTALVFWSMKGGDDAEDD